MTLAWMLLWVCILKFNRITTRNHFILLKTTHINTYIDGIRVRWQGRLLTHVLNLTWWWITFVVVLWGCAVSFVGESIVQIAESVGAQPSIIARLFLDSNAFSLSSHPKSISTILKVSLSLSFIGVGTHVLRSSLLDHWLLRWYHHHHLFFT